MGTQKAKVLNVMWYPDWILAQKKGITRKTGEIQIKSGVQLIE